MLPASFQPPHRLLLGPGPSNVHPAVLQAMSRPLVGHLDPSFLRLMDEAMELLRQVFRTTNQLTFAVSGTGSAGMECVLVNLLEPGDEAIVGVNGVFGQRLADIVERCGATAVRVEAEWGQPIHGDAIAAALDRHPHPKLIALVHAETSTGVLQPLPETAKMARDAGALLVADCVTSLGGTKVEIDDWYVDAAYSGTQKCLSAPPGLSPVTFGPRAVEAMERRRTKVQSWYLDVSMIRQYWGGERLYHHTAPITALYGLHEALRLVLEEGLEARWRRHQELHELLRDGLESLGFRYLVEPIYRLPMLNAVLLPDGVDDAQARRQLLDEHDIEVGSGLGPFKGKLWRIGLMGESCRREHVEALLFALRTVLHGV